MRDAFTIATWCCRSWRVFDRSNPFRVAGEACTKARPSVGRPDSNRHPLVALPLSYTPCGRRSTRPPLSSRRRRLRMGEAPAGKPSTNRRPPGPAPRPLHYREFAGSCPPPWMVRRRGRIRTCNIRFQRPSCCQLHHPPIPSWPARPRWSRFARPITRWAPSAGAGGDGHCPPVRHHALLGLPRQGGCRRGLNMCPMPAVILTPNGWRTLRTRPGFEPGSPPTEGGVLPLHQQATHTPIKQGVRPECRIRFHRQRQGTVCVSSVLSAPSVGSLTQL